MATCRLPTQTIMGVCIIIEISRLRLFLSQPGSSSQNVCWRSPVLWQVNNLASEAVTQFGRAVAIASRIAESWATGAPKRNSDKALFLRPSFLSSTASRRSLLRFNEGSGSWMFVEPHQIHPPTGDADPLSCSNSSLRASDNVASSLASTSAINAPSRTR